MMASDMPKKSESPTRSAAIAANLKQLRSWSGFSQAEMAAAPSDSHQRRERRKKQLLCDCALTHAHMQVSLGS